MLDRGLAPRFDDAVEREARDAERRARRRRAGDLRELPTFTIDPASARDFDDAISAERIADGGASACGCTSPTSARSWPPGSLR